MNKTQKKAHIHPIPFVTGFSLQEYHRAEVGILEASKAKFNYWFIDGSLATESPDYWDTQRIDSLLAMIATHQVKPIYHGNYKVPLASDVNEMRAAAIAYTKREIQLASQLGNAPIILHGGVVVEPRLINKTKQKALENYLRSIEVLADYAAKMNVEIFLENLSNYKYYRPFHYIFTQCEEIDFILSRIESVRLFIDVGHANIGNGDPAAMVQQFSHRIAGMSLSNNDGKKDQHMRIDKGTIDYKKVIKAILNTKWQGIIGFETRGRQAEQSVSDLYHFYQAAIISNTSLYENSSIAKVAL